LYDVPFDPNFPANNTKERYSAPVIADVMRRVAHVCQRVKHTPPAEPREDLQPRVYGAEEEEGASIRDGELMAVFDANQVPVNIIFQPEEQIDVPDGGCCMRVKCGETVQDAAAAAERLLRSVMALKPPAPARGTKRDVAGVVGADTGVSKEEQQAVDAAKRSRWLVSLVGMLRVESVTRTRLTGAHSSPQLKMCVCVCAWAAAAAVPGRKHPSQHQPPPPHRQPPCRCHRRRRSPAQTPPASCATP
jgi:hypothetical protein